MYQKSLVIFNCVLFVQKKVLAKKMLDQGKFQTKWIQVDSCKTFSNKIAMSFMSFMMSCVFLSLYHGKEATWL